MKLSQVVNHTCHPTTVVRKFCTYALKALVRIVTAAKGTEDAPFVSECKKGYDIFHKIMEYLTEQFLPEQATELRQALFLFLSQARRTFQHKASLEHSYFASQVQHLVATIKGVVSKVTEVYGPPPRERRGTLTASSSSSLGNSSSEDLLALKNDNKEEQEGEEDEKKAKKLGEGENNNHNHNHNHKEEKEKEKLETGEEGKGHGDETGVDVREGTRGRRGREKKRKN